MSKTELFVRKQAGGMFSVVDESMTTGNIWWVDSGSASGADAAGYGQNPDGPCLTLDYAIGLATANNGDIIFVMPGHSETKSATGSLWALDQAGIKVIGLGAGADRPTFTFSHTGAVTTISAASCWLENVVFVCGVDSVVAPLTISAADCTLKNVEIRDAANVEFLAGVITTAAADRLTIDGLYYNGDAVTGNACARGIDLVGADNAYIKNCRFHGIFTTACINLRTTKSLGVVIDNCSFENVGTALTKDVVESIADCTFQVSNCFDMVGGYGFSGSDTAALASDDASAIAGSLGAINDTTTDTLHGKLGTDTELADRSLFDLLAGAGIPTAFPNAAAPAADKSVAAVLRDVWDALRNGTGGTEPGSNLSILDYIQGTAGTYVPSLGWKVSKTENVAEAAADDLFTVTGKVLITLWTGEVTNVLGAGPVDYVLNVKTSGEVIAASTSIATAPIGFLFMVPGDGGDGLLGSLTVAATQVADTNGKGLTNRVIGKAGGSCTLQATRTAGDALDAIVHTLWYLPLEAGAGIVAAA